MKSVESQFILPEINQERKYAESILEKGEIGENKSGGAHLVVGSA